MVDWTEVRERSVTSRQVAERERSERARVLEVEAADEEEARDWRVCRMTGSGLSRFLKGRAVPSPSSSERRRFFFSAAIEC